MTAVAPVVVQGKGLWIGWPGVQLDDPNEPMPEPDPSDCNPTSGLKSSQVRKYNCHKILCSKHGWNCYLYVMAGPGAIDDIPGIFDGFQG